MKREKDIEEFRKTGERMQSALKNDKLFEALDIAVSELKSALSNNNQFHIDKYLSLVKAASLMLDVQYASKERKGENTDSISKEKEWAAWAEPDGPIMLKAVSSYGDPIELNEQETKELIKKLTDLVSEIENN